MQLKATQAAHSTHATKRQTQQLSQMSKRTHVPRRPCFSWVSLLLHFTCLQPFFFQCDVWLQARNGLLQAFCNFEGNMITKNLSASEMFNGRMYNRVQIVYYNVCLFSRAWMVYFWLLIAFEGLEISWWLGATHWWCWWSFKLISWFLGIKFEGQDEYSLSRWFSNPIWRFLGSQILITARWVGCSGWI